MTASTRPIGLFYGSSTCYTEIAAEKIRDYFGADRVELRNLADTPVTAMEDYDRLILGIPTWDYGELQEDWEACWDQLHDINFDGKLVAIYGLGDQIGYPDWFQDAMGYLHHVVMAGGAKVCGYWPNRGYKFIASQALTADKNFFIGLALDEENDYEKSEQRIREWCEQLTQQFEL